MLFRSESMLALAERHQQIYQAIEQENETLGMEAIQTHFHMLIDELEEAEK